MNNPMQTIGGHVNVFVDELKAAILNSMAAAAESIRLESEVARVMTRMEAFHVVLAGIDSQKQAVQVALESASSEAQRQSLRLQIQLLDQQTIAVLTRSGLPEEAARQSVATIGSKSDKRDHHSQRQVRDESGQFAPAAIESNGRNGHRSRRNHRFNV